MSPTPAIGPSPGIRNVEAPIPRMPPRVAPVPLARPAAVLASAAAFPGARQLILASSIPIPARESTAPRAAPGDSNTALIVGMNVSDGVGLHEFRQRQLAGMIWSILAARTKSLRVRPSILCVQIFTPT